MQATTNRPLTLITGATGKTGRRVAERLEAEGYPVRRASRSARPSFSWDDESTWAPALEGVAQVYIAYAPDLAVPGALETIRRFTRLAVASGARKLVLLSGRGEPLAQAAEDVVARSGVAHTVVRASWFAQNFDEGHFLDPIRAGVFAFPVEGVAEPFIDVDDIAAVAAAALTSDAHDGELYEVTGPRLVHFPEAVQTIARAAGREVAFVPVTPREHNEGMRAAGVPAPLADFLSELMAMVLDGRNAYVTNDVERALGRPARDFDDYVREAAASGVWGAP